MAVIEENDWDDEEVTHPGSPASNPGVVPSSSQKNGATAPTGMAPNLNNPASAVQALDEAFDEVPNEGVSNTLLPPTDNSGERFTVIPVSGSAAPEENGRSFLSILSDYRSAIYGTIALVGVPVAVYNLLPKKHVSQEDTQTCDPTDEDSDDQCLPEDEEDDRDCVAGEEAQTLYGQVENVALSQPAVSGYKPDQTTRLKAASTNQLVSGLFADASSWEDLHGKWLPGPKPLEKLEGKLALWGGYSAVLDSLASAAEPINSIDDALRHIAADPKLNTPEDPNNSEQTALALAKQIAGIQDGAIVPHPEEVKAKLASITPEKVEQTVKENITTPPAAPAKFQYPKTAAEQEASLYAVPEPMNLNLAVQTAPVAPAATPVMVSFVPDYSDACAVPDTSHLMHIIKPVVELSTAEEDEILELDGDDEANLEEITLDDDEVFAEIPGLLTPQQMGMNAATDLPEARHIPTPVMVEMVEEPVQAPAPAAKSFTEKAKDTVKGWASKLGGWFK